MNPLEESIAALPRKLVEEFGLDRLPVDRPTTSTAALLRLDGKRALVTGGGGDGLGNAICHRLAEQGADVAVLDMSDERAKECAAEVSGRWGVGTISVVADVGDPASAGLAVDEVANQFGAIDILVNNAGGAMNSGPDFVDLPMETMEAVLRLNLYGVLNITKAALRVMLPAGHGRIINVASEGGKYAAPRNVVYHTSKAAVIAFTRNLAHEIGPHGLSIAAVCPGIMIAGRVLTGMATGRPERLATLRNGFAHTTLGRCSLPDEVASVVAFLASDAGSYIHGTAVSVGGGMAD
jgi:3-oxoacyl-[acyl-carrier protein] reductase